MPYGGFDFNAAIFVPFFIAYLVAIMEALGVYQAATEIQGTKLQDRQVRYGLAGEAAGSAISSLIGGFTTTAYPQNVALLKVTDEGKTRTRVPVIIAGVVFVVLGFIPKAGAALSLIPSPVIGGIFLPAAASLISTGFNTLRKVESDDRTQVVIGLSLLLGIALPNALSGLEEGAHVFFSNSILVGAFSVVILKASSSTCRTLSHDTQTSGRNKRNNRKHPNNPTTIRRKGHGMSMGQSQESTNIDETKETIKREVLDFIAQYGCGKAPDEAFDTLAKHIFAFQFERNLPYRAYCMSKRVTPQTLANWMQIPPMPVDGFKMLTLTSVPEQDCEAVFTTSGTTHPGQRGRNFHPDLQVWDESMIVPFRHFIMPDRERIRIAVLSPAWDMNEHSSLSRYLTRAVEQCGAEGSGFFFHEDGLDFTGVERFLDEAAADGEPVMLMGASSAYLYLLDYLDKQGKTYALAADSRVFDTGGFKSTRTDMTVDDLYAAFERVFGVKRSHCVNMYGMTELSSQIYDQNILSYYTDGSSNYLKATPSWVRSVFLDPASLTPVADGEQGVIAHYDLANWNSCLAILTEDLGVRTEHGYVLNGRAKGAEARGCSITVDEVMAANA